MVSLPVVLALVLTGGLLWVRQAAKEPIDQIAAIVTVTERPPLPNDVGSAPVAAGPRPVVGSGGYTFMTENGRGPAAYDPCRPLHVVMNPSSAPAGAEALLDAAIEQIGPAAGLQIVVDGLTDEPAAESRPPTDRARYGNRWSPVLVAWTDRNQSPGLESAVGIGGSTATADSTGRLWNVSGIVHLDSAEVQGILTRREGQKQAVAVIAHELGHVIGLGHAGVDGQLMSDNGLGSLTLSDGDRRGLAALANVPCNRQF
ncbi:hypothetical protein N802_06775 [Knoellia sinensis KCTC 19936]|uniref:Peptidase M10 metallopeptidase domain-containing protein n=2 Tax=Knoellia TaxID=136099 RepID=A0A0A0J1G6_9MICO|nr:hypothetical protein N802_06775 [Knoellia sinensis KCTC 19936]